MRYLSPTTLCIFVIVTIFLSPLVSMADDICNCPDCTSRLCLFKSKVRPSDNHSEENCRCSHKDATSSETSGEESRHLEVLNTEKSGKETPPESTDCGCEIYLCNDGNALIPIICSNMFSKTPEFYQHTPRVFDTSGWVYRTFHPPR